MQSIARLTLVFGVALFICIFEGSSAESGSRVTVIRTPEQGIQPQAAVDSKGKLHLIYLSGDPAAADIFYVRRDPGGDNFTAPLRVNSRPGSAIAIGTVRGAHIALGKGDRVHVAWMGSKTAEPRGAVNSAPMLYARLDDEGRTFERQRNLIQFATGLDGGGSVAADALGNVYVAWHAGAGAQGEASRRVWIARSNDDGRTFAREVAANDDVRVRVGRRSDALGLQHLAGTHGRTPPLVSDDAWIGSRTCPNERRTVDHRPERAEASARQLVNRARGHRERRRRARVEVDDAGAQVDAFGFARQHAEQRERLLARLLCQPESVVAE